MNLGGHNSTDNTSPNFGLYRFQSSFVFLPLSGCRILESCRKCPLSSFHKGTETIICLAQDRLVSAGQGLIPKPSLAPNLVFNQQDWVTFRSLEAQMTAFHMDQVMLLRGKENLKRPKWNTWESQPVCKICSFTGRSRRIYTKSHHSANGWEGLVWVHHCCRDWERAKNKPKALLSRDRGKTENKRVNAQISNGIS